MKVTTEHDLGEGKTVNALRDRNHYPFVPEHVKVTTTDGEVTVVEVRGPRLYGKNKEFHVRVYTERDLWLRPKWLDRILTEHQNIVKETA